MKKNTTTDPIQLQQKIIHFKSELAKYKEKVKDYQDNYHYSQLEQLKEQNNKLREEKEEAVNDIQALQQESDKRKKRFEDEVLTARQQQEALLQEKLDFQNKITRIEKLNQELVGQAKARKEEANELKERLSQRQGDIAHLQAKNKSIQEELQKKGSEFRLVEQNLREQLSYLHKNKQTTADRLTELEFANEKLKKMVVQLQSECKQLKEDLKNASNANHKHEEEKAALMKRIKDQEKQADEQGEEFAQQLDQFRAANRELEHRLGEYVQKEKEWKNKDQLLKKENSEREEIIRDKEEVIKALEEGNKLLKQQNGKLREDIQRLLNAEEEQTDDSEGNLLVHLDNQIKNLLGQTFEYEEELDSKIIFMNILENKLQELTGEIEEIKGMDDEEASANNNQTE
ncbi:hypothetical protein [Thalassobacillus pellis]|uniref:hypothetical protein n=1 Tax=Thalassobacillus pellis TaxID=748008 RepID=UPI00195F8B8C|nr:hypothetical protein [Thalassobacillus pellis]MBM7553623.1 chromosome segregation ATPase [Thalassobacillus pellis]